LELAANPSAGFDTRLPGCRFTHIAREHLPVLSFLLALRIPVNLQVRRDKRVHHGGLAGVTLQPI
jgi:hypothetical protein